MNQTMADAMEAQAKAVYGGNPGLRMSPYMYGFAVDAILAGATTTQAIHYLQYCRSDRPMIQTVVWTSMLAGYAFTGYNLFMMLNNFVYHFGTYSIFISTVYFPNWPIFDVVSVLCVEVFYADRAWRLNNKNPMVLIVCGALMALAFALVIVIKIKYTTLTDISQASAVNTYFYVWVGSTAALDIFSVATIGYGLWKVRTGWSSTDKLIKKLILVACETQLPPTITVICLIVSYTIDPSSSIAICFLMLHPKVYLVGLLYVLNSRYNLRRDVESGPESGQSQGGMQKHNTFAGHSRLQQATVHVHTEQYVESHQLETAKFRPNRDMQEDIKEDDMEDDSVNLDYGNNTSKIGLNDPLQRL